MSGCYELKFSLCKTVSLITQQPHPVKKLTGWGFAPASPGYGICDAQFLMSYRQRMAGRAVTQAATSVSPQRSAIVSHTSRSAMRMIAPTATQVCVFFERLFAIIFFS